MIAVERLTFGYPGIAPPLFQDFSWRIRRGELWSILGPSGCGKSTLLYLLAGLRMPQKGQIRIDGEELHRPRPRTGLILQDHGLLPWGTVRENASLGIKIRGFYGPDGKHVPASWNTTDRGKTPGQEKVDFWLERLGIEGLAEKYPSQLSGGQKQRTAIGRTMALEPDVLLMDEPFSALDAPTREGLQTLSKKICAEQGITLAIVTHSIEEAVNMGQKILLLGLPPNRTPRVFDNPTATLDDPMAVRENLELVAALRRVMEMP